MREKETHGWVHDGLKFECRHDVLWTSRWAADQETLRKCRPSVKPWLTEQTEGNLEDICTRFFESLSCLLLRIYIKLNNLGQKSSCSYLMVNDQHFCCCCCSHLILHNPSNITQFPGLCPKISSWFKFFWAWISSNYLLGVLITFIVECLLYYFLWDFPVLNLFSFMVVPGEKPGSA